MEIFKANGWWKQEQNVRGGWGEAIPQGYAVTFPEASCAGRSEACGVNPEDGAQLLLLHKILDSPLSFD